MKIRQAQKRRAKLAKLRLLLLKGILSKEKVMEKVFKIAPWLSEEEFLKTKPNLKEAEEKKEK